jgi:hypothetical protein
MCRHRKPQSDDRIRRVEIKQMRTSLSYHSDCPIDLRDAIVFACAVVLLLSLQACAPKPPEQSKLVYDIPRTLNAASCGAGNACVDFDGEGKYTYTEDPGGTTHNCAPFFFSFGDDSWIRLNITTRLFFPGDPPMILQLTQVDTHSNLKQNPWTIAVQNTGGPPQSTFTYLFRAHPASGEFPLQAGTSVQGKYILSGFGSTGVSADMEIYATSTVPGKNFNLCSQN